MSKEIYTDKKEIVKISKTSKRKMQKDYKEMSIFSVLLLFLALVVVCSIGTMALEEKEDSWIDEIDLGEKGIVEIAKHSYGSGVFDGAILSFSAVFGVLFLFGAIERKRRFNEYNRYGNQILLIDNEREDVNNG